MLACCCTLAGSAACKRCPTYLNYYGLTETNPWTDVQLPEHPTIINIPNILTPVKKTRVIEDFDENGKLVKRTTEEI